MSPCLHLSRIDFTDLAESREIENKLPSRRSPRGKEWLLHPRIFLTFSFIAPYHVFLAGCPGRYEYPMPWWPADVGLATHPFTVWPSSAPHVETVSNDIIIENTFLDFTALLKCISILSEFETLCPQILKLKDGIGKVFPKATLIFNLFNLL